jgi:L-ribulokinase
MTGVKETVYIPQAESAGVYARLFKVYELLHDAFGTTGFTGSLSGVMKELITIRREARQDAAPG